MSKIKALFLALVAIGSVGVGNAIASSSYQLLDVPKNNELTTRCITFKGDGAAELAFYTTQSTTCTTGTWYYSKFHVLTTPTPGGQTVYWQAKQPSGSEICGRVVSYDTDNQKWPLTSDWVCGDGNNYAVASSVPSPLGRLVLEIRMRSSSTSAKPQLQTYGSRIYTP